MNYFDTKKLSQYLGGVSSEVEAQDELKVKKDVLGRSVLTSDDMRDFSSPAKNNAAVQRACQDEVPGMKHADGTPCKAESKETCPFTVKGDKSDEGIVSSTKHGDKGKKGASKKWWDYFDGVSSEEQQDISDAVGKMVDGSKCSFIEVSGSDDGIEGGKYKYTRKYSLGEEELSEDADGNMCVKRSLEAEDCNGALEADEKRINAALEGIGLRVSAFDDRDNDVKSTMCKRGKGPYDDDTYYSEMEGFYDFEVSDPDKFEAFVGKFKGTKPEESDEDAA